MSLGKIEPDWQCDDEGWNHTRHNAPTNGSSEFCFMINNCTNLTTINDQFTSLVEEWYLVCDLKFVPDLLLRVYVGARIIGESGVLSPSTNNQQRVAEHGQSVA